MYNYFDGANKIIYRSVSSSIFTSAKLFFSCMYNVSEFN